MCGGCELFTFDIKTLRIQDMKAGYEGIVTASILSFVSLGNIPNEGNQITSWNLMIRVVILHVSANFIMLP